MLVAPEQLSWFPYESYKQKTYKQKEGCFLSFSFEPLLLAGKPKDGDPRGCYVVLTINPESSIQNKNTVQVEFIRFEYDVEEAARAVEESPLPNEYAEMLRRSF